MADRNKAEAMFRDAMRLDPNAAQPKVRLAQLLSRQQPDEADKLIDSALADNPRSSEILRVKAEMMQSRGNQDGAMRLFDEALKLDPKDVQAHLSRANINIARGDFKAADEDIDPILKASPNNFMANYLRGLELAKISRGRSNLRPHQPRLSKILVGILSPRGDEIGSRAIRAGGKHPGQIYRSGSLGPACVATHCERCIATACAVPSNQLSEAAG
jgi:tetratricopeptide (TPR) repeat protein